MRATLGILIATLSIGCLGTAQNAEDLRVHEWGTFTSITEGDGKMLVWRPLAATSDLPAFVHDVRGRLKGDLEGTIRMETPVIYFHTETPQSLDVAVRFPRGRITEWYPQLTASDPLHRDVAWRKLEILSRSAPVELPIPNGRGHYFAARAVRAAPVRVATKDGAEVERYLFYRGVGRPELCVSVRLEEDGVRVTTRTEDAVRYMVFENDGARMAHGVYAAVGEKNGIVVPRPLVDGVTWPGLDHRGALRSLLVGAGLFEDEARAMVATWEDDWFEPGLRVFWIVPRAEVDRMVPLCITPEPQRTERVFVGRVEILTPAFRRRVETAAQDLRSGRIGALGRLGRFARPILERLRATTEDQVLRDVIARYLEGDAELSAPVR